MARTQFEWQAILTRVHRIGPSLYSFLMSLTSIDGHNGPPEWTRRVEVDRRHYLWAWAQVMDFDMYGFTDLNIPGQVRLVDSVYVFTPDLTAEWSGKELYILTSVLTS